MNELLERKRAIMARSDLHRELLAMERLRLQQRASQATVFIDQKRWWLIAGAAVVGVVVARRWRGFASWMPALVASARTLLR